ncbi:DUF1704 domain-containing protein [Candidatus Peregrinibacteria bacterium]|nr:DUF1704 domain-containing protein [Candidatus Peregrinibacteria bacterium]
MWFLHNPGILGINARNLLYIRPYNPEKATLMADSKLSTKRFLSARDIPVAKLYGVIRNKKEMEEFNWAGLPDTFVAKPNSGYGGEGIVIIEKRLQNGWLTADGERIPHEELKRHISDILDGRYSLSGLSDAALFEQKLEAPELLEKMSYKGLPDIRIVVHNLIPVMAMLRLPTRASHGKANLHMGGIGVGIDIAKGELTHIAQYNKIIPEIPDFGDVRGIKIPDWEEMLLIASRVQQVTNLGFAAVDLAIDKNAGPVLLEINARAGLSVQVANLAPLRRRLERVKGVKVGTPEKGVRIAQDIFGEKIEKKSQAAKTVIGGMELVEVMGQRENLEIIAKMDPHSEKSVLDKGVAEGIGLDPTGKCKFSLKDVRVTTVVETVDFGKEPYKMLVGKRDLRDFWIDPHKTGPSFSPKKTGGMVLSSSDEKADKIDREIVEIDSEIHLLAHLRPTNLNEEIEKFMKDPSYNPRFEYRNLSFDSKALLSRLKHLDFTDSPLGILFQKKAEEIKQKIHLLQCIGTDRFSSACAALIPVPDEEVLKEALGQIAKMPKAFPEDNKPLTADKAKIVFEKALAKAGLTGWLVQLKEEMVADVVAGKQKTVFIRQGALFTENRLKGTIAHEIETHVFTAMNGARQPYKIFRRGLAGYLATQEGLAVYNQERTEASETPKKYWPASSVIGIRKAMQGSFAEVYGAILQLGFSPERALKVALKVKRGLKDTGQPGAFTKDAVYFTGRKIIYSFMAEGGDLHDLYIGKINLNDLPLIKKIKGIKAPYYLPEYLKTVPRN